MNLFDSKSLINSSDLSNRTIIAPLVLLCLSAICETELSTDEVELCELTDSTLNKLSAMSDEDYAKLELYPDFEV